MKNNHETITKQSRNNHETMQINVDLTIVNDV